MLYDQIAATVLSSAELECCAWLYALDDFSPQKNGVLPVQDKASLQNRLETAINNAEGFGLR